MILYSETWEGASPEILAAIGEVMAGKANPYGEDAVSSRLRTQFNHLFGRTVDIFPTVTGTVSNALALANCTPSFGSVYCHEEAHIIEGEAGAVEFFTGGARLVGVAGAHGKISAGELDQRLAEDTQKASLPRPAVISVTQLTEAGTVYTADELRQIGEVARRYNLLFHMDGSRFANAVAALGCSVAEITCDCGLDILSFGGTKNGTLMSDAIVVFNSVLTETMQVRQKRSGHAVSKTRFLSCQLEAYLHNDLWLRNARHANAMAHRLKTSLAAVPGVSFEHEVQGNEIFLLLSKDICIELTRQSLNLRRKATRSDGTGLFRLVASFATTENEIDDLAAKIAEASKSNAAQRRQT